MTRAVQFYIPSLLTSLLIFVPSSFQSRALADGDDAQQNGRAHGPHGTGSDDAEPNGRASDGQSGAAPDVQPAHEPGRLARHAGNDGAIARRRAVRPVPRVAGTYIFFFFVRTFTSC